MTGTMMLSMGHMIQNILLGNVVDVSSCYVLQITWFYLDFHEINTCTVRTVRHLMRWSGSFRYIGTKMEYMNISLVKFRNRNDVLMKVEDQEIPQSDFLDRLFLRKMRFIILLMD